MTSLCLSSLRIQIHTEIDRRVARQKEAQCDESLIAESVGALYFIMCFWNENKAKAALQLQMLQCPLHQAIDVSHKNIKLTLFYHQSCLSSGMKAIGAIEFISLSHWGYEYNYFLHTSWPMARKMLQFDFDKSDKCVYPVCNQQSTWFSFRQDLYKTLICSKSNHTLVKVEL